jgi:two-component sensor histidine kinase
MRELLYTLINFGVTKSLTSHEKRRVRTVNLLNLVITFFLLVGLINYFILKTEYNFLAFFIFLILTASSSILNKLNLTHLGSLLFTINVNFEIFYINTLYPSEVGSYLYYYPLIVSVVLLSNPQTRDKFALTHFITSILFFVCIFFIEIPQWQIHTLSVENINIMWKLNVVISSVVTATIVYFLARLISGQNQEILVQNNNLILSQKKLNESLKEKEILLAELHHRVKNNLAIISGLLNLQESSTENIETKQFLGDSKNRINSMALVHKMLYENIDLKSIDLKKYINDLVYELFNSYHLISTVKINQEVDSVVLSVNKSIPLGLVLNEIVTNSIKYVFSQPNDKNGVFDIRLKLDQEFVNIVIKDNGKGFPVDYNQENSKFSLGIFLIKSLIEQIDGKVTFSNENGAKIEFSFPTN